jgi:beta-lactamase class A
VLRESGYQYIAPILLCNTNQNPESNREKGLESIIQKYINTTNNTDTSVLFQEFSSNGSWAGIHEDDNYAPASMFKVPAMMAILKYADTHPEFLSKKIFYDGSFDDNKAEYFKPQASIVQGNYYTVDQLLTYMIDYSDNNATKLLSNNTDQQSIIGFYNNLGITLPTNTGKNIEFISPKTYSYFLRILYNSTYLTRESSEKALILMSAPDFPQGLEAGIPSSIKVAQKFGERSLYTPEGELSYRELHDCGIVYAENNPYILCIMTRGSDYDLLAKSIRDISKIVYTYTSQKESSKN